MSNRTTRQSQLKAHQKGVCTQVAGPLASFVVQVPNYDRSLYSTCVIHAKARDGTEIPVSIHYRKDLHKEGRPEPLMLYGYGSYGACMDPRFRIADLSLVDRGVVHAVANIRGGGEMGMGWYEVCVLVNGGGLR